MGDLSSSLSLKGVGGAHVVLEVFVGPRGEEEFHDAGVTVARGLHERCGPILKEWTEREGRGRPRRGGRTTTTHTHTTRERGERKRQRHDRRR